MRALPTVHPDLRCDVSGETVTRGANTMFPYPVTRCAHDDCWREWAPGSSPDKFICGRFPAEGALHFQRQLTVAMENDR